MAKRNKSALKANRQNVKRREHNRELRSKLRTGLKAIRKSLDDKNVEGAKTALKALQSLVDKMATKGIIHKNTASRYKSRLAAKVSQVGPGLQTRPCQEGSTLVPPDSAPPTGRPTFAVGLRLSLHR